MRPGSNRHVPRTQRYGFGQETKKVELALKKFFEPSE